MDWRAGFSSSGVSGGVEGMYSSLLSWSINLFRNFPDDMAFLSWKDMLSLSPILMSRLSNTSYETAAWLAVRLAIAARWPSPRRLSLSRSMTMIMESRLTLPAVTGRIHRGAYPLTMSFPFSHFPTSFSCTRGMLAPPIEFKVLVALNPLLARCLLIMSWSSKAWESLEVRTDPIRFRSVSLATFSENCRMNRQEMSETVDSSANMHRNRGVISKVLFDSDREGGLIFIIIQHMIGGRIAHIRRLWMLPRHRVVYTRELLQRESIDVETLKKSEADLRNQQIKAYVDKIPSNDRIATNTIQVKINHPQLMGDKPDNRTIPDPYILKPTPRTPRVLISANKRFIKTSLKKMQEALGSIKRMHISEAIQQLAKSQKKVAKAVLPTLFNLIDHAERKGLSPYRLFIHGLILGKQERYTGIRYKAKMRMSKEKTDFCQVKVILYEMPSKQFFMRMAAGKAPAGIAYDLKKTLIDTNAPLQTVRKFRFLLTSRGRQQLRELTKRKMYAKQQQNTKNGVFVPRKVILQELQLEQARKFRDDFKSYIESMQQTNLKLRQELFRRNSAGN